MKDPLGATQTNIETLLVMSWLVERKKLCLCKVHDRKLGWSQFPQF